MDLKLLRPHLSIKSDPGEHLPEFALLTGINGSGKTHLLRAIESKALRVLDTAGQLANVRFYDWTTLVPQNTGPAQVQQLYTQREQVLRIISQVKTQCAQAALKKIDSASFQWKFGDAWKIADESDETLRALGAKDPQKIKKVIATWRTVAIRQVLQQLPAAEQVAERNGLTLDQLLDATSGDLSVDPSSWGSADLFQQSFANIFLHYHELMKLNHLADFNEFEGSSTRLSSEEFRRKHGPPPWEFVNSVFAKAGLDFAIDHPKGRAPISYAPELRKASTGAIVAFSDLSSGEKVLMSFAFCMYHASDDRQEVTKPDLLLFDEIDAPLHPSMTRTLVKVITETLVKRYGVRVVMTTHSPSTIAVAPEGSVYVMTGTPPRFAKVTQQQAIALLTKDIPTLSISFDGRRQVLVESENDANYLGSIYGALSPLIESERSLDFIGVGSRSQKKKGTVEEETETEEGAGCAVVMKMTDAFVRNRNGSVLGLVDWDKKNSPTARLHVLAHEERYSVENLLLDPLLLAVRSLRENVHEACDLGIPEGTTSAKLLDLPESELQEIVNRIQLRVLDLSDKEELGPTRAVSYGDGKLTLRLSTIYLETQGHKLYEKVRNALQSVKNLHQERIYYEYVSRNIIRELPEVAPDAFLKCFRDLLSETFDDPSSQ